jgi:pilus assembly protein CpaB
MNRRLLLVLVSAFVIAAFCSYLVYRVVGNRLAATQQKATRVIVAVNDVKLGSVLREADLSTIDIVGSIPIFIKASPFWTAGWPPSAPAVAWPPPFARA